MNIRYPIYEGVYRILTIPPRSSLRFSGHKIPCGNFPPEKTLRYCRPSWGKDRDLASEATYDA